MFEYSISFFKSFFANPNIYGILLAFLFGLIWLLFFWNSKAFREYKLWIAFVASAILTLAFISFVQIPLQILSSKAYVGIFGPPEALWQKLIIGIPSMVIAGVVQEVAKYVPLAICFLLIKNQLDKKYWVAAGAIVGSGFGVFEALWINDTILAAGWTFKLAMDAGIGAFAGFWERFFSVGFHAATTALVGFGLAKGKWIKYLILASIIHGVLDYVVFFYGLKIISIIWIEIIIAIYTIILTVIVILLKTKRSVIN